jgi:uncharacterized protein (TIGR02646 family)
MIRVNRPHARVLSPATRQALSTQHTAARAFASGSPEIARAWNNFRRTVAGQAVRQALATASHAKCVFCERVNARTVDHFYPKERYPKRMFRWGNLLLCCSDCNTAKGARFPRHNRQPALIDPTREDPAEFFAWNLTTGGMLGVSNRARRARARATRDLLRLDDQPLQDERREKYETVRYLLARVVRETPVRADTRRRVQAELRPDRPYLGIIRFWFTNLSADDRLLYDAARAKLPEIDTWVAEWL